MQYTTLIMLLVNMRPLWPQLDINAGDLSADAEAYATYRYAHDIHRGIIGELHHTSEEEARRLWSAHVPSSQPFPSWIYNAPPFNPSH